MRNLLWTIKLVQGDTPHTVIGTSKLLLPVVFSVVEFVVVFLIPYGQRGANIVLKDSDNSLDDHFEAAIALKEVIGPTIYFEGSNGFEGSDAWCLVRERAVVWFLPLVETSLC